MRLAEEAGTARKSTASSAKADELELQALGLFQSACLRDEADACYFAGRLVATPREMWLDPNTAGATRNASGQLVSSIGRESVITASLAEAARLFRKGCYEEKQPSAAACVALGDSYTFGLGQPVQADSAFKLLERGCALKYEIACYRRAARLDAHSEYGPQRKVVAYELSQKACDGGSPSGCANAAYVMDTALYRVPESERNTPAFRKKAERIAGLDRESCAKWNAIACNNIGALFESGRYGVPSGLTAAQRLDSARYYYQLACDGVPIRVVGADTIRALGHGFACRSLGNLALTSAHPDTAAALVQYRKGCLLFEPLACAELALKGYMLHHDSADVSLLRSVTACNEGVGAGCNYAAWLLREPAFNQAAKSLEYFRRACDLNYGWSCYRLGQLETTDSRKAKYFRRACALLDASGCFGLASLLDTSFEERDHALVFYELACDNGLAAGCWAAKAIHRAHNDILNEGLDRTRACSIDKQYCKKPDRAS